MTTIRHFGVIAMFFTGVASASIESIGPDGINSAGLMTADGQPLTGAGISIGQVETGRPGIDGEDSGGNVNEFVMPTEAFVQTSVAGMDDNITAHAVQVAGIMISTATSTPLLPTTPRGVATGASLYSGSDDGTAPDFDPESAITAQHIATVADTRAINMSLVNPLVGLHIPDGNQLLTLFVDWSASVHDVLYVTSMRNDTSPAGYTVPSDNFNGLTIAGSAKVGNTYRQVADFNDLSLDASGPRTSVDLIAPGDEITVTSPGNDNDDVESGVSSATPHATGTAALLHQYAEERILNSGSSNWTANARRHEVTKAVLMNSADKLEDTGDGKLLGMTRTVLKQSQIGLPDETWLDSDAYTNNTVPLDDQMGTGHLNAKRSLQQFSNGEHDFNGEAVPLVGWDYGLTDGQDEFNKYALNEALLADQFVSLTLAWDRDVFFEIDNDADNEYDIGDTFLQFAEPIDLNLYLMPVGETDIEEAVASSIATDTSVEHIFFEIETTGMYEIWVGQDSGGFAQQTYALAWWMEAIANPAVGGDYDGNGSVGPEDYDIWKANFGTSFAAADGNGDGLVDAADYTVWRDNLGSGSGSIAAVPEPSTAWLLVAAMIAGGWQYGRRTSRCDIPPSPFLRRT